MIEAILNNQAEIIEAVMGVVVVASLIVAGTKTPDPDTVLGKIYKFCLLYTSPSPRDGLLSRMPSSA